MSTTPLHPDRLDDHEAVRARLDWLRAIVAFDPHGCVLSALSCDELNALIDLARRGLGDGWIPATMPPKEGKHGASNRQVLVIYDYRDGSFSAPDVRAYEYGSGWPLPVTHWRELPAPPKGPRGG